jgi:hypothetical protein
MKTDKKLPLCPPTIRVLTADDLRAVVAAVHVPQSVPPHLFRQK